MFDCSVTGGLIFLEIQRGKEGMNPSRYHFELSATSACTKILIEETKGLGQRALKCSTRDFFLLNSWFLSKKKPEADTSTGVDLIGMVKSNTNIFFKATIEGSTKDWPRGSYTVLRINPIVTGERHLLSICYNYNSWKVLSFVATAGVGSTMLGILYLSKHPYQFPDVSIRPVACPLLI